MEVSTFWGDSLHIFVTFFCKSSWFFSGVMLHKLLFLSAITNTFLDFLILFSSYFNFNCKLFFIVSISINGIIVLNTQTCNTLILQNHGFPSVSRFQICSPISQQKNQLFTTRDCISKGFAHLHWLYKNTLKTWKLGFVTQDTHINLLMPKLKEFLKKV